MEILAQSEELIATNEEIKLVEEELETTNEELQSAYEDLSTSNVKLGKHINNLEDLVSQRSLELIDSEKRYRSLFENIINGFILYKIIEDKTNKTYDFEIIDINPIAEKDINMLKANLIGKKLLEVSPSHDRKILNFFIKTALNGESFQFDYTSEKISKKHYYFSIFSPQKGYVALISQDISERILFEQVLKDNENKFRNIFENANDAIFLIKDDIFIDCNLKTFEIYGCTAEQIIGNTPYNFSPEYQYDGSSSKESALIKIKLALDGYPQRFEWLHQQFNQKPFDAEVSLNKIEINNQIYILAIVKDITERKKVEQELIKSEERFRILFERSPIAITISKNIKILYANQKFIYLFGYNNYVDAINTNLIDNFDEKSRLKLTEIWQQGEQKNVSSDFEVTGKRKDGSIFFVHLAFSSIMLNDEPYIVSFISDITEQIKFQKLLKDSEVKYRRIVETANEGIVIIDINNNISMINQKFADLLGFSFDELVNKNLVQFIEPTDVDKFYQNRKNREKGLSETFERRFIHKNKTLLWFLVSSTPIMDEQNNYVGSMGMMTDITSRKKAEQALIESEHRMKSLSEAAFEGILFSENGIIFDINEQMLDLLKTKKENVLNKSLYDFIAPESKELALWHVTNKIIEPYELVILRPDGTMFPGEARARIIEMNNKQIRISTIRDLTERKETDRRILNAIIDAEERERSHFSRELHDGLGPTLSTVKLYFQWMIDTSDELKRKMIIEKINHNFEESMLILKEISNNLSPRVLNSLGIVAALRNFIQGLSGLDKLKINFNYTTENRYDKNIEITIYRIVSELINNTIKYAKASKVNIDLKINEITNSLILQYIDNGVGFDLQEVLRKSTGLGLTNIYQRVNTLKGIINIVSTEGKGIKVDIELPLS